MVFLELKELVLTAAETVGLKQVRDGVTRLGAEQQATSSGLQSTTRYYKCQGNRRNKRDKAAVAVVGKGAALEGWEKVSEKGVRTVSVL